MAQATETREEAGKKDKFRTTMWFRKGELDEEAAARAASAKPGDEVSVRADELELDERYADDGSISDSDRERLTLRTGSTMMVEVIEPIQNGDFSETQMIEEMRRERFKILTGLGGVLVLGVIALLVLV